MGADGKALTCAERDSLLRAWQHAEAEYRRALLVLEKRSGIMFKRDYEAVLGFAKKAGKAVEQARAALDAHTAEHGC
jgi:hypothetical protein